jgi:acyl-CoA thioester hydrolase
VFRIPFQVDYADTDAMGVVHHANYFRWFERARVEWLRSMGFSYAELEKQGYILPLREATIQYLKTLVFDDQAEVEVSLAKLGRVQVDLKYRIFVRGELCTTATTHHVLCKRERSPSGDEWKITKFPKEWRQAWELQNEKSPST